MIQLFARLYSKKMANINKYCNKITEDEKSSLFIYKYINFLPVGKILCRHLYSLRAVVWKRRIHKYLYAYLYHKCIRNMEFGGKNIIMHFKEKEHGFEPNLRLS